MADLSTIMSYAKAYGFVFPSSDIYEGLQGVYDYGPYGVQLKRNLQAFWWKSMTQCHNTIVGLDAAILMAPQTWKASGHIDSFHDWMVDHLVSKKRYRVDVLVEEHAEKRAAQGDKEGAKALLQRLYQCMKAEDGRAMQALLIEEKICCPLGKTAQWTIARKFNLMFGTEAGAIAGEGQHLYLRPETAQGIFVNFLNVQKTTRLALPFGIAQIGKAFRNELIARQFIFRMREFEQMEMQFFVAPGQQKRWFNYWKKARLAWFQALGIPAEHCNIHPHEQLAHYAQEAVDITYAFPMGQKEVEGIHSRTDFDLRQHEKCSKKKMNYFDASQGKSYIPYVVETSIGLDRLFLMMLCHAYKKETLPNGDQRTLLCLPPPLAPVGVAVLPHLRKPPFLEAAKKVLQSLQYEFSTSYQTSGSIGKRYRREDLIGTPYCLTIDHQTLEDGSLTLRERDTMTQQRISLEEAKTYLRKQLSISTLIEHWQRPTLPLDD